MTGVFAALFLFFILCFKETCSDSFFRLSRYTNTSPRLKDLRVLNSWKKIEFSFPSGASKKELLEEGHYIPGNAAIIDADYWSKGKQEKIFVTLPRLKPGIPATLATVSSKPGTDKSPLLQPYPDWSWHGDKDCEVIISVFRTKVDECNRLWVLDSGVIDALNTQKRICPPKLLAFDLVTDNLIFKYLFPETVVSYDSLLVTVVTDVRNGHCSDVFAYIADVTQFALIVVDVRARSSWKVTSNFFYPFPTHGVFSVAGEHFELMDGLLGLALSPLQSNRDKTLYFHSLASVREGKVSTNLLRNSSNFANGHNHVSRRFLLSAEARSSQSAAQDMSRQGILFFGLLSSSSIACWNSHMPYVPSSFVTVAQNNKTLRFPSGMKVVWKNGREELLVTTSTFHKVILGNVNHSDDNFHILSASVPDLVRGTLCDPEFGSNYHSDPDQRLYGSRTFFPRV